MFSLPLPSPPLHAKACISCNCDTNAHIKLIFDTAIGDPVYKNLIAFDENRKIKMADGSNFVKIWLKYDFVKK